MMQELLIGDTTERERQTLFIRLYEEAFPLLSRYVSKMGGSFEEAKDVFQDALIIFYEKMQTDKLDIHVNDRSYLLGIARHLYLKRYNSDKFVEPLHTRIKDLQDIEQPNPSTTKLLRFIEIAGKKCMDLLVAFYYDRKSLAEIADNFGYSGIRSATVQKYKCIEKVRETIKTKALNYEDFLD